MQYSNQSHPQTRCFGESDNNTDDDESDLECLEVLHAALEQKRLQQAVAEYKAANAKTIDAQTIDAQTIDEKSAKTKSDATSKTAVAKNADKATVNSSRVSSYGFGGASVLLYVNNVNEKENEN